MTNTTDTIEETQNPFFHNYLFTEKDMKRVKTQKPWWEWPWLAFLPTYVQINDGYAFFYKQWGNKYFIVGHEPLPSFEQKVKEE